MKKLFFTLFFLCSISTTFSQVVNNTIHPLVKIEIPSDFKKLTKEEINRKYTIPTNRPTVVYASTNKTANISYNHTQNLLPKERVKELKELLVQQFSASKMRILSNEIKVLGKNEVIFIEMIAPSYTEGSVYNVITATNLEDRMLLVSFNCPEYLKDKWRDKAFEILKSIRIKK